MNISLRSTSIILGFVALVTPLAAQAAGTAADAVCVASHCTIMKSGPNDPRPICKTVPCSDVTNGGTTSGHCATPTLCHGETAGGTGLDAGLGQLGQILGQLMGKLMQGQPSQPSSPSASLPSTPTTGCVSGTYFQTSDITQLSNPCAQYTPPATPVVIPSSTSTCDALSQLLGSCNPTANESLTASPTSGVAPLSVAFSGAVNGVSYTLDFGDGSPALQNQCSGCTNATVSTSHNYTTAGNFTATLTDGSGNTAGTATISVAAAGNPQTTSAPATATKPNLGTPALLSPSPTQGQSGDIVVGNGGATIYGSSQDLAGNTGVAGFFGNDTFGGSSLTLGAQLCRDRPWASGVLGAILPASFFDGICHWRGYQVGEPPAQPSVQLQQSTPAKQPAPAATSTPTDSVKVQIWATPASVPLDTRTSIFWSTQGVTNCTETSPDGNFNQNSLSGGAATVPITGATTFTISCTDAAGNPVTDYVTVNLSI